MFRKLLLALVFVMLPIAGAHALGLGGISLQSRLNQPLDAEIELRSIEPGDLEKLRVSLASREEFDQAGIDRPFVLASLNFTTVQRGEQTIIKVTTNDAFREPFVSFLLKVEWPNGRLLREYTLLLDPPVVTREAAPAVQAPSAGAAPQVAPAQAVAPRTPTQVTRPAPAPRVLPVGGDEYRVRRGDSLTQIARDTMISPGISSQQAMLALLRANPEAFINDNINLLKEGYVLRIPSAQEALSVDQAEAVAEVRRQVAEWRTYRQQRTAVSGADASTVATAPQPRLEVVAPQSGDGAADSGGEAAGGPEVAGLQRDLALATEAAEARRLENEELREQVTGLEAKLEEMQRMVTIKVDELAALQARLREAQAGAAPAPTQDPQMAEAAPSAEEAAQPEMTPAEGGATATEAAPGEGTPGTGEPGPEPAVAESAQATPAQPQPLPQASVQPPAVEPAAAPDPMGFVDDLLGSLMNDPVKLGGVGGGVLLLILLLFYMAHRRKAAAAEESGFGADLMEAQADNTVPADRDEEFLDAAAAMDIEDFEEPETPERTDEEKSGVDQVIAEADVYLAYGRYQQAEELIKGTLQENPDRLDLKSKLLEVYFATRDRESFEALVEDIHGELQAAGGAEWDKLQLMGQDLCPGNPLFGGAEGGMSDAQGTLPPGALDTGINFDPFGESAAEEAEDETAAEDNTLEFDMTAPGEAGAERDSATAVVEPEQGLDFDFDLGEETEETEETAGLPEVEGEPSQALDFDSTLLGVDQDNEELDLSFDLDEAVDNAEASGLDLDFGAEEDEASDTDLSATDFDLELNTIQTDAERLEQAAAEEAEKAAAAAEPEEDEVKPEDTSMAEDRDFSIEWDITGMGLETPEEEFESNVSGAHKAEPVEDLESTAVLDFTAVPLDDEEEGEADMVATKLDLAKAYIDMGDSDGARNILDEVIKEGNDTQREEAQDLLAGL